MRAERQWLRWVRRLAAGQGIRLTLGIGDDAALLRPRAGHELALTTDLMVEGVHFLRGCDPPALIGRKLATRALSDLAAMGAQPRALLVSTVLPAQLEERWARAFYRSLVATARAAGAALAGGDLAAAPARSNHIILDVMGVGDVPAALALRRDGAQRGDRIFVSGALGEAELGRRLAHRGRTPGNAAQRRYRARYRRPQARWRLGLALRSRATAAIDVSDGLAPDLHHLCRESGVGAVLRRDSLPADAVALQAALFGGEDYELLFTLPPGRRPPPGCLEIGFMETGSGVWIDRQRGRRVAVPDKGWEHFIGGR